MRKATLLSLVLLLFGCKQNTDLTHATPVAGPNIELHYPVVLISSRTHTIETRADPQDLTTTTILHNDIFDGMQVIDSSSDLYSVENQRPAEKVPGWPANGSGNARYRIEMRLRRERKVTLVEARQMLLQVIKDPASYWSQSHYGASNAVKKVMGAKDLAGLIAACRESSKWL